MPLSAVQIEALNDWARTQPAIGAKFVYAGPGEGLGDLLSTTSGTDEETKRYLFMLSSG